VISSLVVLSGFIESVYAAKKVKQHNYGMTIPVPFSDDDKSSTQKAQGRDAGDLVWSSATLMMMLQTKRLCGEKYAINSFIKLWK
jgi:hypothetical protein